MVGLTETSELEISEAINKIDANSKLARKRQEILNRISASPIIDEETKKIQIVVFINPCAIKYLLKNSEGKLSGYLAISRNPINSKLDRNNELFNKHEDVLGEQNYAEPIEVSPAQQLASLVESQEYDVLDNYIGGSLYHMAEVLGGSPERNDLRNAITQVQVLFRNINKTKADINIASVNMGDCENLYKQLEVLYNQIGKILIEIGYTEIPKLDEMKVANS